MWTVKGLSKTQSLQKNNFSYFEKVFDIFFPWHIFNPPKYPFPKGQVMRVCLRRNLFSPGICCSFSWNWNVIHPPPPHEGSRESFFIVFFHRQMSMFAAKDTEFYTTCLAILYTSFCVSVFALHPLFLSRVPHVNSVLDSPLPYGVPSSFHFPPFSSLLWVFLACVLYIYWVLLFFFFNVLGVLPSCSSRVLRPVFWTTVADLLKQLVIGVQAMAARFLCFLWD